MAIDIDAWIEDFLEDDTDSRFCQLSYTSKVLTAISLAVSPDRSIDLLLERIAELNPSWAELIDYHGVEYYILTKNDAFRISKTISPDKIICDIEDWHPYLDKETFVNTSKNEKEEWAALQLLLSEFVENICKEVVEKVGRNTWRVNDVSRLEFEF